MQDLENNRLFILKRLGILRLLSIIEAVLVCFLAFVFIKDILIAIILACMLGILFFKFTSKRLILAKKELETKLTRLFLRQNKASLKNDSISEKDFLNLAFVDKISEFKSLNSFYFEDFVLYDLLFKDEFKRSFSGILISFKKDIKSDINDDISQIFVKIRDKNFNTKLVCKKGKNLLISSLKNPFFPNLSLSVRKNLDLMQENLQKIRAFK